MGTRGLLRGLLAVGVLAELAVSVLVVGGPAQTVASAPPAARPGIVTPAPATTDRGAQAALAPTLSDGARTVAVQMLLDRWAAAVRADDDRALAALFDPRADPGFLDAERTRAHNLSGVPLAEWGYEIGNGLTPTVPPGLLARVDADEVWSPPVNLSYALAGADLVPTTRPVGLVVARRAGVWRLVSDTAVADYGRTTWRGPWDFGPVFARSVATGVVLGHPGHARDVDTLAGELDAAVAAVTDFWGPSWPQRGVIFLPDTAAELKALVGPDFSGGEIAAVATADDVDRATRTTRGQRVVFNPATIDKLTELSRRVVLRHELTHVAARAVTAPQTPVWLAEGFADYSGYRGSGVSLADGAPAVAALVRSVGPPDSLPTDAQFTSGTAPAKVELAYQLSWSFAVFVATVKGEPALRAMYQTVAALPAPSAADIDAAVAPIVGTGLAGLVIEWGHWLQTTLR